MICLKDINKIVGSGHSHTHALKNISLNIQQGEYVAIVGSSGSGKSTLMNIIGCLDKQSSGKYCISKVDVTSLSHEKIAFLRGNCFGFVFQRYNLLGTLSVLDNVLLPTKYSRFSTGSQLQNALDLLTKFGLENKTQCTPEELSGGQQQKVSIARALINNAQIILADEPTGALDTSSGLSVMSEFKKLNQNGRTIILVTHNNDIANMAGRIIEIQDGKIICDRKNYESSNNTLPEQFFNQKKEIQRPNIGNTIQTSIKSITTHKLRSTLTMLGIIIGIVSLISVISLGKGSQAKLIADIQALGTNTIEIFPGQNFGDLNSRQIKTLTVSDSDALASKPYVKEVSPQIDATGVSIHDNLSSNAVIHGVNSQYFNARGFTLKKGRYLYHNDIEMINSVAIIDSKMESSLFFKDNAIGKFIIFNGNPLEIVGIVNNIETPISSESNPSIFIPHTTYMYKIFGEQSISSIIVKIKDSENTHAAEKDIINFLQYRHNNVKDFFTFNIDNIKRATEKATKTMTLLISSIAFISLVVGGIGVMNIMLVSVTERRNEIGLRMAVGARKIDILYQFLAESIVICLLGGTIGIIMSFSIKPLLKYLSPESLMIYSFESIVLALLFSTSVGLFFGFIPAKNASSITPVDALRRD